MIKGLRDKNNEYNQIKLNSMKFHFSLFTFHFSLNNDSYYCLYPRIQNPRRGRA